MSSVHSTASQPAASQGLRERNKQEKRKRIVQAARSLFVKKGFDQTTTKEVADKANVGTGTLFLYAQDKAELLFLVFQEDLLEAQENAFATLPLKAPVLDQIVHVFLSVASLYEATPKLSRSFLLHLFGPESLSHPKRVAFTYEFIQRLANIIEAAKHRGEIRREVSEMLAASNFFAIYVHHVQGWLGGLTASHKQFEALLESALGLACKGVEA